MNVADDERSRRISRKKGEIPISHRYLDVTSVPANNYSSTSKWGKRTFIFMWEEYSIRGIQLLPWASQGSYMDTYVLEEGKPPYPGTRTINPVPNSG